MLGYYKRHVLSLSAGLSHLRDSPRDLSLLVAIQEQILQRIVHTEQRKSHYRSQRKILRGTLRSARIPRHESLVLKKKISAIEKKISQCQWLLYLWRCFGDGIAHTYLDKWDLKAFIYNAHDTSEKERPGGMSGKAGLENEFHLLRAATEAGVPALLTDLTNTIRHGDLCFLVGPEPHVVEVKSSGNWGARTARQAQGLRAIQEFLEKDEAEDFRGLPFVVRHGHALPEVNYLDRLDHLVSTARQQEGSCKEELEPGARLVALVGNATSDLDRYLSGFAQPHVLMLNAAKNEKAWGPFHPFTLSLRTPENLYAFLRGDVYLLAMLDLSKLQEQALAMGLRLSFLGEGEYALMLELVDPQDGQIPFCKLSTNFFLRMGIELISWRWMLENELALLRNPSPLLQRFPEK